MTKDVTTLQRKLSEALKGPDVFTKPFQTHLIVPRTDAENNCDEFPAQTWNVYE